MMNKNVQKIQSFVDENIEDMVEERKATLAKYEQQFNQIKLVCCKYFEKYDIELETVKLKAQNVMDKYQDWSKVLIEPASLNDARLFALESRMHEEEEIRIKEYEFVRDVMKKLIYSLEKTNISQIDGMLSGTGLGMKSNVDPFASQALNAASISKGGSPRENKDLLNNKSTTPVLPNLLNNVSLQNSVRENINLLGNANKSINDSMMSGKSGAQSTDIMMLKRLNFLRNSLETHNTRETTHHLRDQALKKRDERILELWRNDLEKPSVYEMVQQMKKNHDTDNMHSSKFNHMLNSINSFKTQDQQQKAFKVMD